MNSLHPDLEEFLIAHLNSDEQPQFVGKVIRIGDNSPKIRWRLWLVSLAIILPGSVCIFHKLHAELIIGIVSTLTLILFLVFLFELALIRVSPGKDVERFLVVTNTRIAGIAENPRTFTEFAPRSALRKITSDSGDTLIEFDDHLFHCKPISLIGKK